MLPTNGADWPLPGAADTARDMAEWSAWYSGDPTQLEAHYAGTTVSRVLHPTQLSGGVVGRVARWWWGTPTAGGEQRGKLHVPLAADIAATSADLLFAEPVQLTAADKRMNDALTRLRELGLDAQLHEAGEVCSALGGVYLRTCWDDQVQELPWLDAIQADGAIPEFRHGRVVAITLWTQLPEVQAGITHRMLERHEPGAIEYALYAGTATNLGSRKPLQDHPDTESLAELVNAEGLQLTDADSLTVTYVPNMLPNRRNRRSHQGRSDLQGVTPLLDCLDEAYSSWWRDIRHGKSRIHVPESYLDAEGPGQGASLNLDRELYVPVAGVLAKGSDGLLLDAQQFAIRVEEHSRTCTEWANAAVRHAGYSVSTFGDHDGGGTMTATEVRARQQRSFTTRDKKVRYWTLGLRQALHNLTEIANTQLGAGLPLDDLQVQFPDGIQESTLSLANTVQALRNAEAASIRTRVQMVHPDWDTDQLDAEVAAIQAESGAGEPVGLPGDAGL